jgi:putative chitinase
MAFDITVAQLSAFAPAVKDPQQLSNIVQAVNNAMDRFQISQSDRRVRYFMAHTSFETSGFTSWEEDLTYEHPERLVAVWPSRFSMTEDAPGMEYAPDFVNAPERLANLVYANRNGNGDEASGDGYAYRGRGGLDLTFHNNYSAAAQYLYNDSSVYLNNPDLMAAPTDAFLSAGWFWEANNLNALADSDSFTQATRVINGSTDTVGQRLPVLNQANAVFTW